MSPRRWQRPFLVHLAASVLCVVVSSWDTGAQAPDRQPSVDRIEPAVPCADCSFRVIGSNLWEPQTGTNRAWLVRPEMQVEVTVGSFHQISFDRDAAPPNQVLIVDLPAETPIGGWQLVVQTPAGRSRPVPLVVGEWRPPVLRAITPLTVAAGQHVRLTGADFPQAVTIDLLDDDGLPLETVVSSSEPDAVTYPVPRYATPGRRWLRVRVSRSGADVVTRSLPVTISAVPPAPTIALDLMAPAAPGQWTDFMLDSNTQALNGDRFDVEFRQGAHVEVTAPTGSSHLRIQVPETLIPGQAALRARVWKFGLSSEWSEPVDFGVLAVPAEPVIHAIAVIRAGQPAGFWSTNVTDTLRVRAGDQLFVGGEMPTDMLRLIATSPTGAAVVIEPGARDDPRNQTVCSSCVRFRLPQLAPGEWRLTLIADNGQARPGDGVVVRVDP